MPTRRLASFFVLCSLTLAACGSGAGSASAEETTTTDTTAEQQADSTADAGVDSTPGEPASASSDRQEATIIHATVTINGTDLEYAVATPDGYRSGEERPLLLAMPPGGQTIELRDSVLGSTWAPEADKRGWVVVSPSAPDGVLFFQGSEELIPDFLDLILAEYPAEGGRVHLAGISNGGISSFRIAAAQPELIASITVAPGFPRSDSDQDALAKLVDIPVVLFVGSNDSELWITSAQDTETRLSDLGGDVTLNIEEGEGHFPGTLSNGVVIFDLLDSYR